MASAPPELPFPGDAADHDRVHAHAERLLLRERSGHTLQPTALVHEACLRLRRVAGALPARALVAAYVRTMRRVLVDHARRRRARLAATGVAAQQCGDPPAPTRGRELERCLASLAATAPRLAKVVELRFLRGLPVPAVARALGVTERTVVRDWADARVRLRHWLADGVDD
jgi:RNA polymerase sigma-70 factor (ECF subfamily)